MWLMKGALILDPLAYKKLAKWEMEEPHLIYPSTWYDNQISTIQKLTTTKQIGDVSKSFHKQDYWTTKLMVNKQFTSMTMQENEIVHSFIERFQVILNQIVKLGMIISNDDIVMQFIRALPPSLHDMYDYDWKYPTLTLPTLIGKLRHEKNESWTSYSKNKMPHSILKAMSNPKSKEIQILIFKLQITNKHVWYRYIPPYQLP